MPSPSKQKQLIKSRQRPRHGSIQSSHGQYVNKQTYPPEVNLGVTQNHYWDESEGMYQLHKSEQSSFDELS